MEEIKNILKRNKPTILVVDDEMTNRQLLEYILIDNNYYVHTAEDGDIGLRIAKEIHPDLILLDIRMPKMDGLEVCKELQKDQTTQDIPIIFITSVAENEVIVEGLNSGAVDYVKKPFKPRELIARIEIHLELKQALDNQKKLIENLKAQIEENKQLRRLIPICFHCKKVRDDQGFWDDVESYMTIHSNIDFSHGICPECQKKYYSDTLDDKGENR
ncbi:MAG: response regulator [Candidatus Marinimicrobia bacterium]|nr:response regulator [Candidatus Neomarinimicrobiota bacterium]